MFASQKHPSWENPTSIVHERKFDTALRKSQITDFLTRLDQEELLYDDTIFCCHHPPDMIRDMRYSPEGYALILQQIYQDSNEGIIYSTVKKDWINRAWTLACDNLKIQHRYSSNASRLGHVRMSETALSEHLDSLSKDPLFLNLSFLVDRFSITIEKLNKIDSAKIQKMRNEEKLEEKVKVSKDNIKELELDIRWSHQLCSFTLSDGTQFLYPKPYILMVHNKLCDLFSCSVLTKYLSGVCYPPNSYYLMHDMVSTLSGLCVKHKDKFFPIASSLEGLVSAETLQIVDDWKNDELLEAIHEELQEETGFIYIGSRLQNVLRAADTPFRHELGCLSKIVGHPLVDMKAGAFKLYKRTTEHIPLDPDAVNYCVNQAKESFVRSYILRHGKWPPCELSHPLVGRDALGQAMLKNKDPYSKSIETQYGKIQKEDWARITLLPCLKFSQVDNIIPLLKDKTISMRRSKVFKTYLTAHKEGKIRWEETRLLLYYLLNPLKNLDHQEFLARYTNSTDLTELADYLVIRIVPKEKELKNEFRGFGVKTYEDRMRGLIQEKNAAHFLSLYSEEQAMTLGELELINKLYALRTIQKAYVGHDVLYVNFDAAGWNNRFRDGSVRGVMKATWDRIFDFPIFSKTQLAFEHSLIYVPDGYLSFWWDGQLGGIEGLNQDSWVWTYLQQIKYAFKDQDLKYHVLCKGDDLRVAVIIPPQLKEIHPLNIWKNEIVQAVSTACLKAGHLLKVRESYGSGSYLTFSKSASCGTIELPQGLRKIMKVYGANNAFMHTLDEYIASTFSNAHSACKVLPNTYGPYFVALIWSYYYLLSSVHYNTLKDTQLVALMLIPNLVGGFPMIYLHNMYVRAESDLLSPFLDILQLLERDYHDVFLYCRNFLRLEPLSSKDLSVLYRDPYSLCFKRPVLPSILLRSYILPVLKRIVKNEDVLKLIQASESAFSKEVIECLASANVQDAKIFSVIYSALPVGVLQELIRKFETGRSVLNLILLRGRITSPSTIRKFQLLIQAENKLHAWRANKLSFGHQRGEYLVDLTTPYCPAQKAQELRDVTWQAQIVGLTMPPLAHQVKISEPSLETRNRHSRENHFTCYMTRPNVYLEPGVSDQWATAGKEPFLGYITRTGKTQPTVSFIEKDIILVKVQNLLDLLSWVNKTTTLRTGEIITSNLSSLIQAILRLYCPDDPSMLAPFAAARKSGTVQHHMRAPKFREAIVPNTLSNIYQNVEGQTNTHQSLRSKGNLHFRINFLHVYCFTVHLMHIDLEFGPRILCPREHWCITTSCSECSKPIKETPIVVQSALIPLSVPEHINTCKIDEISKSIIKESFDEFTRRGFKKPTDAGDPTLAIASSGVVQEFVSLYSKTHIQLQDRFTQSTITPAGHRVLAALGLKTMSRDVGLTELKLLQMDYLIDALTFEIFKFIHTRLTAFSRDDVEAIFISLPAMELPWFGIVQRLKQAGRMGMLVCAVAKLTKIAPPMCFNNEIMATIYIAQALGVHVLEGKCQLRRCLLSYYDQFEVDSFMKDLVEPWRWKLFIEDCVTLIRAWIPGSKDPDGSLKRRIVERGIYVLALDFPLDRINRNVIPHLIENKVLGVDIGRAAWIEFDDVYNLSEDDNHAQHKTWEWVQRNWPSWPWISTIETVIERGSLDQSIVDFVLRRRSGYQMEIGLADIGACIEVVRCSAREKDPEASSSDEGPRPPLTWISAPPVQPRATSSLTKFIPGRIGQDQDYPFLQFDFTYRKIMLDPSYCRRLFGSGTSSMNKLIDILSRMNVRFPLPDHMSIACLGEGFGGFIECLSSFTHHSYFLYNSKPTTTGVEEYPYLAHECSDNNRNHIDTESVNQGYYDLTESFTLEHLDEKGRIFQIMTCDAEIPWTSAEEGTKIALNVAIFFLRNSDHSSLLVLRGHLGQPEAIIKVCHLLSSYCDSVYMIRSPVSSIGGEMYITATHRNYNPPPEFEDEPELSRRGIICVNRFIQSNYDIFHTWVKQKTPRQVQGIIKSFPLQNTCLRTLGVNCDAKILNKLGLTYNTKDHTRSCNYIWKRISTEMTSALKATQQSFSLKLHGISIISQAGFDDQRWVSGLWSIMKVLAIDGALAVIDGIGSSTSSYLLKEIDLRERYRKSLASIPKRYQLRDYHGSHFYQSHHYANNKDLNPYQHFTDGIRLMQSWINVVNACIRVKP